MCEKYNEYPKSKQELKELRKEGSSLNKFISDKPCEKCGTTGLRNISGRCITCKNNYQREYYKNNPEKVKELSKEYRRKNIHKVKEYYKEYGRKYYKENSERVKIRVKEYKQKNVSYYSEYMKNYQKENRAELKKYHRNYEINRLKYDPSYRMNISMRGFVRRTFKAIKTVKSDTTHNLLGYSPQDLMNHLEAHFLPGMSWDNYGEWHIDHMVSIMEHLRNGIEDPAIINALDNLRPMWAADNISKGDKPLEEWLNESEENREKYEHYLDTI